MAHQISENSLPGIFAAIREVSHHKDVVMKSVAQVLILTAMTGGLTGLLAPASAQVSPEFSNPKIVLFEGHKGDGGYWTTSLPDPQNSDPSKRVAQPLSADHAAVRQAMMKRRVLENYAAFLSPLHLPTTYRVFASDCAGSAWDSPYYDPDNRWMNMCYSFVGDAIAKATYLVQNQAAMKLWTPVSEEQLMAGLFAAAVLHETGHAVFDLLSVPVFGREEDAADQMAAFIALQFGTATARTIIKGFAYYWGYEAIVDKADPSTILSSSNTSNEDADTRCLQDAFCAFSDMHGTASQRMYNTLCMAYGGNHVAFQDMIDAHWLPPGRVQDCDREYQQAYLAFGKTVYPFIDQARMAKVQARQWFEPEELKEK
jgi:Putative metallopeptidase